MQYNTWSNEKHTFVPVGKGDMVVYKKLLQNTYNNSGKFSAIFVKNKTINLLLLSLILLSQWETCQSRAMFNAQLKKNY